MRNKHLYDLRALPPGSSFAPAERWLPILIDALSAASFALGYCLLPFQDVTQQLGSALAIPDLRRLT